MNLHRINRNTINTTTPFQPISIYLYLGQTFNKGDDIPNYSAAIETEANIQLENAQNLKHLQGINLNTIYKRFFINNVLTGLNRNLANGGDYITWIEPNTNTLLKYKIIEVVAQFNVGYTEVVGAESVIAE